MHHTFFQPTNLLIMWLRLVVLTTLAQTMKPRRSFTSTDSDGQRYIKHRSLPCLSLDICHICCGQGEN